MQFLQRALLNVAGHLSAFAVRLGTPPQGPHSIESAAARMVANQAPKQHSHDAPEGYVPMSPRGQLPSALGSAVIVASDEAGVFVPVFVGASEALALRLRLEGETFTRPLTHDLLDTLLEMLGATVEEVRVEELRGNVFVASIAIRVADEVKVLDARASDAVIVAVGHGLPVLVSQAVIETAGRPLEEAEG